MYSILVTGAASGIGAGIAAELADFGHHVVVGDVKLDAAREVARRIVVNGNSSEAIALDVTSDDSVVGALASLSHPVDVLVNNAGLQHTAPIEEFDFSAWNHSIQVTLTGAARLTRAVLPAMRRGKFGRIINLSSVHSLVASPYESAHVAANHGLAGFAKAIALETADTDITVNTICPSLVKTPEVQAHADQQIAAALSRDMLESEGIQRRLLGPMPKGVFIGIDEIAGITLFLLSPAARNITGQMIVVDGGLTVR